MPDLFGGMDWGGAHHQRCVLDAGGQRRLDRRFAHARGGLEALDAALAAFDPPLPIALERGEGLLVEHLLERGHLIYPVNPRVAARTREAYRAAAIKDDAFDACVLADALRQQHRQWRPLRRSSAHLSELRALGRDRQRLLENQHRVDSQLRATLATYHPAAAHLFSSVDRAITLAFIRQYPTPEQASRVGVHRMARFRAAQHYTGRQPAEVLVARLRAHLLQASAGTTAARSRVALDQVELLELFNRQLKTFQRRLAEVLRGQPDAPLFLSFPGVNTLLAATFLAEMGEDRQRFPSPRVLLAEAGLAPVTRASGRTTRVRFRYAANTSLRDAFNWWAFDSIRLSPWARAAYQTSKARGQHHHRALRGLAARWARVLWRCWQDGVPYAADRHASAVAA